MVSKLTLCLVLFAGLCAADTTIEEFPSLVQIERGVGLIWGMTCGGTVLTSRHVLTAAQCTSGLLVNRRVLRIRAGATSRGSQGVVIGIESISNNPGFGTNGFDSDISVLRLDESIDFSESIQQATIVASGTNIPASLRVINAGWDSTERGENWSENALASAQLAIIEQNSCVAKYMSLDPPVQITDNMICALSTSEESTSDVGGPIFYDNIVVGVVSFGNPNNETASLVSTNVGAFTNWIIEAAI